LSVDEIRSLIKEHVDGDFEISYRYKADTVR
jgi:hypothetical protein